MVSVLGYPTCAPSVEWVTDLFWSQQAFGGMHTRKLPPLLLGGSIFLTARLHQKFGDRVEVVGVLTRTGATVL